MQWRSSQELHFLPDGKHFVSFPTELPLNLVCYRFDTSHLVAPNYHDYLEISYAFEGEGVFYVGDRSFRFASGDVVLMGNTQMHRLEVSAGQRLNVICVFFLPEFLCRSDAATTESEYLSLFVTQPVASSEGCFVCTDGDGRMLNILRGMEREMRVKDAYYQQATKVLLLQLLLTILRSHGHLLPNKEETGNEATAWTERLQPVISFVHARVGEKITNADLASAAHMSPSYFCRFFKRMTGMTPTNYILRVRIDAARKLLLETDMSVTQIAFRVGFENHSYFDKVFKRLTGATPRDFRRRFEGR